MTGVREEGSLAGHRKPWRLPLHPTLFVHFRAFSWRWPDSEILAEFPKALAAQAAWGAALYAAMLFRLLRTNYQLRTPNPFSRAKTQRRKGRTRKGMRD